MGLDSVELVMAVEESFGILIPDSDAPKIVTVGDLYEFVLKEFHLTEESQSATCLSRVAFYRIRRGLMACTSLKRQDIRPTSELPILLPSGSRRSIWRNLQSATMLKLPELLLPRWAFAIIVITPIVGGIGCGYWSYPWVGQSLAWLVGFAVGIAAMVALAFVVAPLGRLLPRNLQTVGDLSKSVVALNYRALAEQERTWNAEEIWDATQRIVCEQLGVQPQQVTRTARFVKDLGMG